MNINLHQTLNLLCSQRIIQGHSLNNRESTNVDTDFERIFSIYSYVKTQF